MTLLESTTTIVEEPEDDAEHRAEQTNDPDESTSEVNELPKDVIFGLLSAKRRRDVLMHLEEAGGESTLSDLAEQIAADENGIEPRQLSSQQRKRVYIGLYQCHLPKMDDANVIEFNQARGHINIGPNADLLLQYLDATPSDSNTRDRPDWLPSSKFTQPLRTLLTNSD
jgi:hypothetical protein